MTTADQKKENDMDDKKNKKQILLSESISLNDDSSNKHVLLVGGTEDERRYSYIAPNILNTDAPVIVTDRDGILYRGYRCSLKDKGYDVKLLDPAGIVEKDRYIITDPATVLYERYNSFMKTHGCDDKPPVLDMYNQTGSYNPLSYICEHEDVEMLAGIIVAETFSDKKMQEAGKDLLAALIAYLHDYTTENDQTFDGVIRLLRADIGHVGEKDVKSVLDLIFDEVKDVISDTDADSFACEKYDAYKEKTDIDCREDLILSCLAGLRVFMKDSVAVMTSTDSMDLDTICGSRTALFIVLPSEDRSYDFIATMLYAQMFGIFNRHCREHGTADDAPVRFMFMPDEFVNIAKVPGISSILHTLADNGASVTLPIPFTRARRYTRHPEWKDITDCFDTAVYLSNAGVLKGAGWFDCRPLLEIVNLEGTSADRCVVARRPREGDAYAYVDTLLQTEAPLSRQF